MTDSKEWCDGDWRCRSSSKPFAGAESGSPGRALEAGKRGSPGRPVQAGIRGKRLNTLEKYATNSNVINFFIINPRGDHWAEFGPRDQCRSSARPKFGPIWYDVVEQFSFPSLVTDPGKKGVIGKLIHSSSCANFIQVQNAVSPNENPRYKTCGKVVPIFG